MPDVNQDTIRAVLQTIIATGDTHDIVTQNYVSLIRQTHGNVWNIVIELPYERVKHLLNLKGIIENTLKERLDLTQIHVAITAQNASPTTDTQPHDQSVGIGKIKHIIAIASGKGGVGKSTFTTNLAVTLSQQKFRVGILDADIYGPSQGRMMGVSGAPDSPDGKIIIPKHNHGVKMISISLMVAEKTALVWRGPMVQSALFNLLDQTQWGELDILLIDMPPGTGDIALSLSQKTPLSGAIIISTPQDIALLDARKAISMFERVSVPILGLVENMSYFQCAHCGEKETIFGTGGVKKEAQHNNMKFLGDVPLHTQLRIGADDGIPVALEAHNPITQNFKKITEELKNILSL